MTEQGQETPLAPQRRTPKPGDSLLPDVAPPELQRADSLVDTLLGTRLGNYEINFVLGKGSYGTVYKARDVKLGRFVALKFLHEFLDARHEAMFLREAQAIAALGKHPSIVQIFEWSEFQGRNYFVLEFVGSSAVMLLRINPSGLPAQQAARIVMECAEGLAYAHKQEIVHRDVKPANILLEIEGGRAKLADFGVAKFFDPAAGHVSEAPGGSPPYMAPEIVCGGGGDPRSDIFSLGVTFYELLTGKLPFPGQTAQEVMERIRLNAPVPLTQCKTGLPSALAAIADKAMAHNPGNRFPSADAFAQAIHRFLDASRAPAVSAAPPADGVSAEEMAAVKTRAYKAAEDAKRAGADKLAHPLLAAGIEAFRDGEAHERLRQYGPAAQRYQAAQDKLVEAEKQAGRVMTEIRTLKAAQRAMEQARAAAAEADAQEQVPEAYAAASEEEERARKTAGLPEATQRYEAAGALYRTALVKAHESGEATLVEPRKQLEAARQKAETLQAAVYAAQEMAAAEELAARAQGAVPDFKRAQQLYTAALARYHEALRISLEHKRLESEKQDRSPITVAGIELVWIPPGSFEMGSRHGSVEEEPVHKVTVSRGFWIGRYPVTQEQWAAIMGENPSGFRNDPRLPVENVSWDDCQVFIDKLNALGLGEFRLPSEAEWEYACRAGSEGEWCFGSDLEQLDAYAWFPENAGGHTHAVGQKRPNAWGLHDMHGNVCEWCQDTYSQDYSGAPADGSACVAQSVPERVTRGGSWCIITPECRSAYRGWYGPPDTRTDFMGLRICRNK